MQMYDDGMIRPCEHKATKGPEDHGSRVKTEDHGTRGPWNHWIYEVKRDDSHSMTGPHLCKKELAPI